MTPLMSRLRGALKSACYSGLRRDRWQQPDRVLEVLDVQPGQRVADLGAGGGYFTFRLARAAGPGGTVYAVDADPDMLARIAARAARGGYANVRTVAADDERPSLPEAVDLVLSVDAFHHLPREPAYYTRLASQLAPGGRVAIIEARPRWFLFGHATEPADIRSILTAAGYRIVSKHDFLEKQSFMVFARPDASGS